LDELRCNANQLTSLDARNGNNQNLLQFEVINNPNLTCINVDDVTYSTNNWTNIDAQHYFSTNCTSMNLGCTDTLACNFDPLATIDDGSCYFAPNIQINQLVAYNLELVAIGGTTPYVYLWNILETNQTITPLFIGNYWCVVTDINNCVSDTAFFYVSNIVSAINETTNTDRKLLRITDMLGQETPYRRNNPLFYIYNDGTVEKKIILE